MEHVTLLGFVGLFVLSFLVSLYATIAGGAALVFIPLFTLMGIPILPAIAHVRVVSVFLQLVSILAFQRKKVIDWKVSIWSSLWTLPASFLGAFLTLRMSDEVLRYLAAAFMAAALLVVLKINLKDLKKRPVNPYFYVLIAIGSFLLGIYGGLYGAAFSTLLMLLYIRLGGENVITASANASVVTLVMSVVVSYAYIRSGLISWGFIIPLVAGGILGTVIAVELAVEKGSAWIKVVLATVILLSLVKLLFA
ncbi:MAG TPA: sulfite exporter TauE/SafE family protein [Verrucomicrobiae bacterium]|nr:sulfite exporter TauE/SafE family protein [Verrucomicrobiae bacterium]